MIVEKRYGKIQNSGFTPGHCAIFFFFFFFFFFLNKHECVIAPNVDLPLLFAFKNSAIALNVQPAHLC